MNTRNVIWLAVIAVAVVVGWIVAGPLVGVIAGAIVLIGSEIIERTRRRRRAAEAGTAPPRPLRNSVKRKPQRR